MNFWERTENKEHGRWNWELRFHLPSSPAAWSARSGQGAEHLSLISNLWNKPLRENPAGKREPCRVSQEGVLGNCTHHRQVSHLLMGFSWFPPHFFKVWWERGLITRLRVIKLQQTLALLTWTNPLPRQGHLSRLYRNTSRWGGIPSEKETLQLCRPCAACETKMFQDIDAVSA